MKKTVVVLCLLLFAVGAMAQHNRKTLTWPGYDEYNLKGWPHKITVVQKYEQGEDVNFQETYLFDSTGHLTEYRKRGFGGEVVTRYPLEKLPDNKRYTFDYDGDVLQLLTFDLKGRLYSSTHCIYGDEGNLVQTVEYVYGADTGVVQKRTVTDYDKYERASRIVQYSADELALWKESRKYDRRGNMVRRVQTFYYDEEVTTTDESRAYTFDKRGNWTECRYSLNGKLIYTIIRKIEYYGE